MLDDLIDLLEPTPRARVDLGALERAVDLAFAAGGTETSLDDCLDRTVRGRSTWEPSSFERDVFLADLVRICLPVTALGRGYAPHQAHLRGLLAAVPTDLETVGFRQEIFRELRESPERLRALEVLFVELRDLKRLLAAPELGEELERNRRRVDALEAVRRIFNGMASGFEGSRSALSRLDAFGKRVIATQSFAQLDQLLDFEGKMAAVEVRLRLGHDGSLRNFDIVASKEDDRNPFYRSPFRRFWQRLTRFFRGYKYSEDVVLEELIDRVFSPLQIEVAKLFVLMGDIEFYLAGMGFAALAKKKGLEVCLPELVRAPEAGREEARELVDVFNPLLFGESKSPVPCSLRFPKHDAIVVFSGPNSGGKTRLLQALAIAQMMGQAGLFVPARSARLVFAEGLFVSLIEEAKSDQREGRLGMELMRIRDVFERLRPGGVVMLDELCSGTNPSEGEEIFELVVSLLAELEPQAFITTHFLDFAARLEKRGAGEAKLEFMQVELDVDDEPTYQFVPGVAKSSLAKKTAARLGVTRDQLQQLVDRSRRLSGRVSRTSAPDHASDQAPDSDPESGGREAASSAPGEREAHAADGRGAGRAER